MSNLKKVKEFWEINPLWSGESKYALGSKEFFEEHRKVYIDDCFAGKFDQKCYPPFSTNLNSKKILDLGCGIGFWATEFGLKGYKNIYCADLTNQAIKITKQRSKIFNLNFFCVVDNAEKTRFKNSFFDHVNCQGVIHHTPNTEKAIEEISRILKTNGTASISVYYENFFLKLWPLVNVIGKILTFFGGGLRGRGREKIFQVKDKDEIVRMYDGDLNPIGKAYSRKEFIKILSNHFEIKDTFLHFFPARSLPFKIPKFFHKFLDQFLGFMIYANVQKIDENKKCVD